MSMFSIRRTACGLLACAVLWLAPIAAANADVTIDGSTYVLITSSRVDRDHFDFTFTAVATNSGSTPESNCVADLTSSSPNTQVRDGELSFPPLPPGGSAVSNDTFTVRQHRLFPFNAAVLSWNIECSEPGANARPLADAGPHQSVMTGSTVTLDGSGSTDPEGSPVTYLWSIVGQPVNSTATLSDPTAVLPTFVADVPGLYEFFLVVNDGTRDSSPAYVMVATETENTPPVAHAGTDQNVSVNQTVHLDGTASTDVNGGNLGFEWSFISRPAGSNAVLVGGTTSLPTFLADAAGQYRLRLIVTDQSQATDIDEVVIFSTQANRPPVAMAGVDRVTQPGVINQLDGTGSSDPDGTLITSYAWSLIARPSGSSAVLTNTTTPAPSLQTDRAGDYVVQLVVGDGTLLSAPDTVLITTNNAPPVAQAGPDQLASIGALVQLQGSGTDANGDPLSFQWSLTTKPTGSTATPATPFGPATNFTPDLAGLYTAQLIVNDGTVDSTPDTVNVSVGQANTIMLPATLAAGLISNTFVTITLARDPATTGTVVIEISSSDTNVFAVQGSNVITFQPGQNSATAQIRGQGLGTAELRAVGTSPAGFPLATSSVSVTARIDIAQLSIEFPKTSTRTFTVRFESPVGMQAQPTPAMGGLQVTLTGADPACVALPSTVTIPVGTSSATVLAAYGGAAAVSCTTTVTAIGPAGFASDSMPITVASVGLNIVQSSLSIWETDTTRTIGVRYETPLGTHVAAPPGGLPFTLSTADASCVSVPATGIITHPPSTASVPITYGGSAPLPCTTTVTATGPAGFEPDSVTITVTHPEVSLPFLGIIGAKLQSSPLTLALPSSNHGGVNVQIASTDPARVLIAPNSTTPGSGVLNVFVPNGSSSATFVVQGGDWVAGQSVAGEVLITASAPGFHNTSRPVSYRQATVALWKSPFSDGPLTFYTPAWVFGVRSGVLSNAGTVLSQDVRAGATLATTISNSAALVAALEPSNGGGWRLQTLDINVTNGSSASTFRVYAQGVGTSTLTATTPNGVIAAESLHEVEVTPGGLDGPNVVRVGAGLQRETDITLDSAEHGGVTVHVASNDPRILLALKNGFINPGTSAIDVEVPAGQRSVQFYVQALDWAQGGSAPATIPIAASGPGVSGGNYTVDYVQPAVRIRPIPAMTIQAPNRRLNMEIGIEDGTEFLEQRVRWGGLNYTASVTSTDLMVAQIEESGGHALGPVVFSPDRSTPRRAVEIDAVGIGTATITASIPGFVTLPSGVQQVSITDAGTQAQMSLPTLTALGAGLQTDVLAFDIPHRYHNGMTVTITSSNTNRIRVATGYTTSGSASPLTVAVPAGATRVDFILQGRPWTSGSSTGTVTITASTNTSEFTPADARPVSYQQATIGLTLPFEMRVADANVDLSAVLGVLSLAEQSFTSQRAGPAGVVMTLQSNFPNVLQLDPNGGGTGAGSVVRTIPAGEYGIPFDAAGGVELDPLSVGVTAVSASAPGFMNTIASGRNVPVVP
jgi:hypothetical protein